MTIGVVDYGLGNLASVAAAIERVGGEAVISFDHATLMQCDRFILPGVGAFPDGMANLHQRGLLGVLTHLVCERQRPILGVCLGFQLLARRSSEFGETQGLGWIDADVDRLRPIDSDLRVPHVGWNDFSKIGEQPLFADVPDDALFYYVHSYHMICHRSEDVAGTVDYGQPIVAAIRRGNVHGTQFHPEKSQRHGLRVLQNFIGL